MFGSKYHCYLCTELTILLLFWVFNQSNKYSLCVSNIYDINHNILLFTIFIFFYTCHDCVNFVCLCFTFINCSVFVLVTNAYLTKVGLCVMKMALQKPYLSGDESIFYGDQVLLYGQPVENWWVWRFCRVCSMWLVLQVEF